jgi:hypothetical protein
MFKINRFGNKIKSPGKNENEKDELDSIVYYYKTKYEKSIRSFPKKPSKLDQIDHKTIKIDPW